MVTIFAGGLAFAGGARFLPRPFRLVAIAAFVLVILAVVVGGYFLSFSAELDEKERRSLRRNLSICVAYGVGALALLEAAGRLLPALISYTLVVVVSALFVSWLVVRGRRNPQRRLTKDERRELFRRMADRWPARRRH